MRLSVILAALLFSSSAFAAKKAYKLDMALTVNGDHLSSPKVVVKEGETATVTQQTFDGKNYFDVVAKEGEMMGHKGILMEFRVGQVNKDGSKTIISRPKVLAKEGEEASISVAEDDGKKVLFLKVTANRAKL